MSDERFSEQDLSGASELADQFAREELPFRGLPEPVRAIAVTLSSLNGRFAAFLRDHVVGRGDSVYIERPPGTQYCVAGPGTIRQRQFATANDVCIALAQVLIGKRNPNLDEPHELLARDFVVSCGGARWTFKSSAYRGRQRAAAAAAGARRASLAAALAAGLAGGFARRAAEATVAGARRARGATISAAGLIKKITDNSD